jgi:O-succinylbenzoate synthase
VVFHFVVPRLAMKIEKITLHHLRMPLVSHFETSFGRIFERDCILVEIQSEGLTGWGECVADRDPGYSYETSGTAWHILQDFITPLLLGQQVAKAHNFQYRVAGIRGHHLAKAGVEMALWDLLGQRAGKSLRELFGGQRGSVAVGVSVGLQDTPEILLETVSRYIQDGYRRVKLKIKPGRDIRDTEAVRRAFPQIQLQVDANSAYTLETARGLLPLDDLDLLLIEQPLFEDDIWDHASLQKNFKTPICLDESIISPRHARYAIEMQACRIINIKPARCGGLSHGLEVHDLCQQAGIPVWCGGMLETNIGRASNLALASLPNFLLPADISASARYYREDLTEETFTLNSDSTISVPEKPGLGVTVIRNQVEKFTLARVVA